MKRNIRGSKKQEIEYKIETFKDNIINGKKEAIIAYNIINAMKRIALPDKHKSNRMLTIRSTLIKVAGRFISHSNKFIFKLSSSFPYKKLFMQVLTRINQFSLS